MRWEHVTRMGEMLSAYKTVFRKREWILEKWDVTMCIYLTQNTDNLPTLLNIVMNLRVPQKCRIY